MVDRVQSLAVAPPDLFSWQRLAAERRIVIGQLLRFGIVGLINTAVSYAIFAVLIVINTGPLMALIGTTVLSLAFNYQTSRRLVFRIRTQGQIPRFLAVYAVVVGVNWMGLRTLASFGIPELAGQAMMVLPIALISFAGQSMFVFGSNRP